MIVCLFDIFSLGAEHDGSAGATSCSSTDGYIMSSSPPKFQTNERYSRNPWLFSKCSVKAFTKTLKNKKCAKSKGRYSQAILNEWDTTMMNQPGELFTVNEQCHIIYGNGSTYCGVCTMCVF
ncbi:hypothetical protein CHS0354_041651 [Potamilus streckersoni]|uniref:Uncharacterized protein n=1 Tax=Potamilus streckersoni TaxID=2493646 RepID=A0AAE0SCV4_9BIVA|nr:hypothetical protein CHS0354_041651 [Potamilus streckersoni]